MVSMLAGDQWQSSLAAEPSTSTLSFNPTTLALIQCRAAGIEIASIAVWLRDARGIYRLAQLRIFL